jgi:CRISPR-associated protein Cmr4
MPKNTRIYWLHALTPLHVGAGRGVGYIDLPILREKVTNLPLVPGSAVKGVLADYHNASEKEHREADHLKRMAFGISDPRDRGAGESGANSGSLVFTDARLVCLPVRSFYGTFAWCTSPMVLKRLRRDLDAAGMNAKARPPSELKSPKSVHVPQGVSSAIHDETRGVFLEDLDLAAEPCPTATAWASELGTWLFGSSDWSSTFAQRFAVVPDDIFNFLCETGTEVTARVRIDDDKKTVAGGALWYEESLPAETILAGLVWCDRVFGKPNGSAQPITEAKLLESYCSGEHALQIGGKATVGNGRMRCQFTMINSETNDKEKT